MTGQTKRCLCPDSSQNGCNTVEYWRVRIPLCVVLRPLASGLAVGEDFEKFFSITLLRSFCDCSSQSGSRPSCANVDWAERLMAVGSKRKVGHPNIPVDCGSVELILDYDCIACWVDFRSQDGTRRMRALGASGALPSRRRCRESAMSQNAKLSIGEIPVRQPFQSRSPDGRSPLRLRANRGLVFARTGCLRLTDSKRKTACVATGGPSLGRKRPTRAAIAKGPLPRTRS
jgi:hypothetical protein